MDLAQRQDAAGAIRVAAVARSATPKKFRGGARAAPAERTHPTPACHHSGHAGRQRDRDGVAAEASAALCNQPDVQVCAPFSPHAASLRLPRSAPLLAQPKDVGVDELSLLTSGTILVSSLGVMSNKPLADALAQQGVTAFAMEMLPRITRAQSMDILSSQSNLSGYKVKSRNVSGCYRSRK